jgi:DNA-binding winged helix-turn-helix (wHTH) protein/tetratricopeptide (TPR) repeat protein
VLAPLPEPDFRAFGMATEPKVLYEFGPFRVDPDKQVLLREDQPVAITPKAFETLLILVRHSREVVSKDELMKAVWPDAFVEEANLSQNIFVLRKALGDTPEDRRYIVTLPGRGYRFAAQVRTVTQDGEGLVIESRSRTQMVVEETDRAPSESLIAFPTSRHRKVMWKYLLPIGIALVLSLLGTVFFLGRRQPIALGEKDTVLVGDFTNTTGDPVFDGALRQGLAVQLEQSPFLSVVSDQRVRQTLHLMEQPADARLTPEISREVCQRTGSAVVLDGSIAQVGTQYLLTLKAVSCVSGDSLASTEVQAGDKDHVLDALGKTASQIRNKLGESLSTVQKFDTPLEQATTPSLEALKAFSSGYKVAGTTGSVAAIPFFERAIELDPNFALAYALLGRMYEEIGEVGIAANYTRKAYELRDRASEPEKYYISFSFNKVVRGNMEKAEQSCKLWIQAYPRSEMPHAFLIGAIYPVLGQYEKGVEEGKEAIRLNPDFPIPYALHMFNYTALNRLDEAKATYGQALGRKLNHPFFSIALYEIAFLQNDAAGMAQQVAWSAGQAGIEDELLGLEADTSAYSGRLRDAREYSRRAVDSAERAEEKETAATYSALSGLREALFGNADEARRRATLAVRRSAGRDEQYFAGLALAYAGDGGRAQALSDDLGKRFPEDTLVQFNYLPTLRAKSALSRGNASKAIENLRAAAAYELGVSTGTYVWTGLYPIYVRGEAHLAAHQGSEAVAEFQKILDHRGIVVNEPIGALAHLGLARAYVLQGDTAKARAAYQDFLTRWKDADPDIPIFIAAKSEYAKLH